MTKILKLSPGLELPLDALMQPIALLGNRGGGKTYGGMKLYELAHDAGVQCIAIDGIGKWWGLRLGGGEWKMLKVLIDAGGAPLERDELAQRAGFEVGGGTFRTYLPKLHTLGLIDYLSDKRMRANSTLLLGDA